MELEEYLEEVKEMDKKGLKAFLDAPNPEGVFNPMHQRKFYILECANWYMDMRNLLLAIKEQ